jgi:hypothetical protein
MKKLYRVVVEATEKVKIECTIYAKNAKDARKKLTSLKPWNKTNTEDEISRIELDPWKILIDPKEIK